MEREIRGKFINGKVELLEESDLEEGEEVWIVLPLRRKRRGVSKSAPTTADPMGEDTQDHWEEVLNDIYERRRQDYLKSESLDV